MEEKLVKWDLNSLWGRWKTFVNQRVPTPLRLGETTAWWNTFGLQSTLDVLRNTSVMTGQERRKQLSSVISVSRTLVWHVAFWQARMLFKVWIQYSALKCYSSKLWKTQAISREIGTSSLPQLSHHELMYNLIKCSGASCLSRYIHVFIVSIFSPFLIFSHPSLN